MSSGQLKTIGRHSIVYPNYWAMINDYGRYDRIIDIKRMSPHRATDAVMLNSIGALK